jgi:hypothetical protein
MVMAIVMMIIIIALTLCLPLCYGVGMPYLPSSSWSPKALLRYFYHPHLQIKKLRLNMIKARAHKGGVRIGKTLKN